MQCYYLGGLETSATGILGEMSKPLSWSMPPLKVCEKLQKKDAQVCDLRFGKQFFSISIQFHKFCVSQLNRSRMKKIYLSLKHDTKALLSDVCSLNSL